MVKKILYIVTIIILSSCKNDIQKSHKIVTKWYYSNGKLKKIQEYNKSGREHGTYAFYYPNGVLKDSAKINNNKFQGKRFGYYENSKLYRITNYINGVERNIVKFNINGSLKEYIAFTYTGEAVFIIHYDTTSRIMNYEGNPIHSWVQEKSYPIGKEFSVELLVIKPPNCKEELIISDWSNEKKCNVNQQKYTPDESNKVTYSRKQNPIKDLYILHVAKIQDTIWKITLIDTLIIKVAKDGKSTYTKTLSNIDKL
ncbi:MAG: hypothetical protein ABI207_09105 [Crocinitomicaceae bacterium]